MALCDSLEQEVTKSKVGVKNLMKSVLREVFEGEKKEENELLNRTAEPKGEYTYSSNK